MGGSKNGALGRQTEHAFGRAQAWYEVFAAAEQVVAQVGAEQGQYEEEQKLLCQVRGWCHDLAIECHGFMGLGLEAW